MIPEGGVRIFMVIITVFIPHVIIITAAHFNDIGLIIFRQCLVIKSIVLATSELAIAARANGVAMGI